MCGTDLVCSGDGTHVEIGSTYYATSSKIKGGCYVGKCPFRPSFNIINRMYSEMPSNASQLDEVMCGPYNRRGLLCGECKDGYGPAVYLLSMKCADCSDLWSGYAISLYLVLQLVPITLIFIILVMFRFNITSGPLLGYMFFCQMSMVYVGQRYQFVYDYIESNQSRFLRTLFTLSITLSQFWSLQFFKAVVPPFCISEKLTGIHILMLEFIPVTYPIFLVIFSCFFMELNARNYTAFRNLRKKCRTIMNRANIRAVSGYGVIHSFASFIFLSNTSVLSVVFNIADTTTVAELPGGFNKKVIYVDSSVEWPSHKILPYLLITIVFFVSVSLIPSVLFCIYPTRVYRYLSRFLSARKRLAITAFAEALHSCYKDGLNGTCDYRGLAGAPVFVVLVYAALFNILIAVMSYGGTQIVLTVLWMLVVCVVTYMKPCKSAVSNLSLSFHMSLFGILICAIYLWGYDLTVGTYTLEVIFLATFLTPHILVALWAGYTLTKHTLTRFGYQFHGPGCKVALSDMANGVRLCLCRRHRGYQEMCE